MPNILNVAAIQYRTPGHDIDENLSHAVALINKATAEGAQFIVLPELFATGYFMNRIKDSAEEAFAKTTAELKKITTGNNIEIVAGIPVYDRGKIYNSALSFSNGEIAARYDKINLFAVDDFSEADFFTRGERTVVTKMKWGELGMMVCADVRFPEYFVEMALNGAKLITISAAFPYPRDAQWISLTTAEAAISQCFIIASNRSGADGHLKFCGRSQIIGPDGAVISKSIGDEEEIIYAELDMDFTDRERKHIPAINSRKID